MGPDRPVKASQLPGPEPGRDPAVVGREYATEERFLARRLTTTAELHGPRVEDAIIAAIAERRPRNVVDVGCGTGDLTERIRDEVGVDVIGLDRSPRMVELTRARRIEAETGDIESLPFVDARFDCVLANRVLYHLRDLTRGLREIARVLRSAGSLIAVTYSDHHLGELWDLLPPSAHPPLAFSAENGTALLGGTFSQVERRDVAGFARFPTVAAVRAYFESYGEFATFSPADVASCLGAITSPFDATYRHSIFVARHAV